MKWNNVLVKWIKYCVKYCVSSVINVSTVLSRNVAYVVYINTNWVKMVSSTLDAPLIHEGSTLAFTLAHAPRPPLLRRSVLQCLSNVIEHFSTYVFTCALIFGHEDPFPKNMEFHKSRILDCMEILDKTCFFYFICIFGERRFGVLAILSTFTSYDFWSVTKLRVRERERERE